MNNSVSMASFQIKFLIDELIGLGKRAEYILKNTELDITKPREFHDVDNYETELIQVAAVAVAALTDIRMQRNNRLNVCDAKHEIIEEIMTERDRQDSLFGRNVYPINQDPVLWVLVLLAELREVTQEIKEIDICQ